MKTYQRILLSIWAAVLTASLGAFWFWSMGCKWVPGEALGLTVGMILPIAGLVAAITFVNTEPKLP